MEMITPGAVDAWFCQRCGKIIQVSDKSVFGHLNALLDHAKEVGDAWHKAMAKDLLRKIGMVER